MPVPTSIDSNCGVRHLTIGRATRRSTSDLQFPPRKIVGSESNEDESLREWERRENLNLDERKGEVARTRASCRCAHPGARAARVMAAWHSSPRRTPDATMLGWFTATSSRRGGRSRERRGRDEEGARGGVGEGRREGSVEEVR